MKNTLKTLLVIAGLMQGTTVFAESPTQVNFSWNPAKQQEYTATVNGLDCEKTAGNLACSFEQDKFVGAEFSVTHGKQTCTFKGTDQGLAGPVGPCDFVANVDRNNPKITTVKLNTPK